MEQIPKSSLEEDVPPQDNQNSIPEDGGGEEEDPELAADFEKLVGDAMPEDAMIKDVLNFFTRFTYSSCNIDPRVESTLNMCTTLFEKDYSVIKIDNKNSAFTYHYPATIPVLVKEKTEEASDELSTSSNEFLELLKKAYLARCRERFPVPVILCQGKVICRSSTLAGLGEVMARTAYKKIWGTAKAPPPSDSKIDELISEVAAEKKDRSFFFQIIDDLQTADIALLKKIKVGAIFDLMVEDRKHKVGIPVSSSEKADKENRYFSLFKLMSIPFPGCEFFKEFHDRNFSVEGLYFNWSQRMCDAELSVNGPDFGLNIDWSNYKKWDLIQMTQNYVKYILKYFEASDTGILIHCISGWDRTPLFISLLRLSLWADGLIHKSLEVADMLFLTLAYDWMLFGHHLSDRLAKREDILLFCFAILKYLTDDSFSVTPKIENTEVGAGDVSTNPTINVSCVSPEGDGPLAAKNDENSTGSDELAKMDHQPASPLQFETDNNELEFIPDSFGGSGPPSISSSDMASPIPMELDGNNTGSLKRTSPVEIPPSGPSKRRPGSNLSNGSWQMVSATGSLRGSDSHSPQSSQSTNTSESSSRRKTRLSNIRRLFYKCYYHSINEKHVTYVGSKNGILKSIFNNLTELYQPTLPQQVENP